MDADSRIKSLCLIVLVFLAWSAVSVDGQVITRNVGSFTGLEVWAPFSVEVSIGKDDNLVINARVPGQPNITQNIETVVDEKGTLKIRLIQQRLFTGILQITVGTKSLKRLIVSSSGQVNIQNPIETDNFQVLVSDSASVSGITIIAKTVAAVISESGSIIGKITTDNLSAVISTSGTMHVSGSCVNENVQVSTSGVFFGKDLKAASTSVTVNGSGRAEVFASGPIKASVTGLGVIRYAGTTDVTSDIQDQGVVEKL